MAKRYSGPRCRSRNWIPNNGEDFFLIFRVYGPEKALFDRTWTLPDIEKVK